MKKNFCIKPFDTLWINPNGSVCVCCKNNKIISDPEGNPYNITENSLGEVWMSEYLQTLRQQFIDDERPEDCKQCWDEEAAGIKSLREGTTDYFFQTNSSIDPDILIESKKNNPIIQELNLTLTNKCNLACRICTPFASSLWVKEAAVTKDKMLETKSRLFKHISIIDEIQIAKLEEVKFKDDRLTELYDISKNLKKVYIYGGEPLINEEILEYLKKLVDDDLAKEITLVLNTNATIYKDSIIEMFSKFKEVEMFLSIDGIGKEYEYQRYPARYPSIERNIKRFAELKSPFKIAIYVTMSILNIIDLEKMLDTFESYNITIDLHNMVHYPGILNVRNLSSDLKEEVISILENIDFSKYKNFNPIQSNHKNNIINFIKLSPDVDFNYANKVEYRNELFKFVSISDEYRKTPIADYLPNLYNLLHTDTNL